MSTIWERKWIIHTNSTNVLPQFQGQPQQLELRPLFPLRETVLRSSRPRKVITEGHDELQLDSHTQCYSSV